jgi:hypothetical protein
VAGTTTGSALGPSPGLQRATRAVLLALGLALVIATLAGSGSDGPSGRLGGDYPAFYAAGRVFADDPGHLYDPEVQRREQQGLYGSELDDGQLYFAYPPFAAIPYAGLGQLPYRLSYLVHTFVMAGLLVLALHLIRPLAPVVDRYFEQAVAASLVFYPMFIGIAGGQNTAVTLVLLAVAFRSLATDQELVAGVAVAAMLFKPQYAIPVLGLLVLARRWRAVAVAVAGGLALHLVSAAFLGWGWVGPWIDQVRWLAEVDAPFNAHNGISWLGVSEAVWGPGSTTAVVVGWSLAAMTVAGLAWAWFSSWRPGSARSLPALMTVTPPALLLLVPHVIYYDAGLLLLALAVLATPAPSSPRVRWALVAVWAGGLTQVAASTLGIAPVWLVTVAVLVWAATSAFRPAPAAGLDSYAARPTASPT